MSDYYHIVMNDIEKLEKLRDHANNVRRTESIENINPLNVKPLKGDPNDTSLDMYAVGFDRGYVAGVGISNAVFAEYILKILDS